MAYTHVDVAIAQEPRRRGRPCGDVVSIERTAEATTVLCCDGIGSGSRAHLAATLCASRLTESLRRGFSARRAVETVAAAMERQRALADPYPFAAFSLARVRADGHAAVLAYESPPPILTGGPSASVLPHAVVGGGRGVVLESQARLEPGDGLLIVSDGITQAGLGAGLRMGWGAKGAREFLAELLRARTAPERIPERLVARARELSGDGGDDCSAAYLVCRSGRAVTILTGPPARRERTAGAVEALLEAEGVRVVCGGSTAGLVAQYMGRTVAVREDDDPSLAPPRYELEGIDLVTEGAVTLNQAFNVLGSPATREWDEDSGVAALVRLLEAADRVRFIVGLAENPASGSISYRRAGILNRREIVPLLAGKLRAAGKLVEIEWV